MPYDVVTIGAASRDVFIVSDKIKLVKSKNFSTGIGECVAFGTKIEIDTLVHTTGGGATNAAATFSALGFKTAAVCRIGDDMIGDGVLKELAASGIDTKLIRRVKGDTAYSTLLTAPNGERTVFVYRGVSATFTKKDLPLKECKANWFYLTSLGGNMTLAKSVITHASRCGAKIAWNPGSKEIAAGITAFKPILKHVNVLNMNREEAQKLTKETRLENMIKTLATPGNILIITDGTKGAYAHRDGETIWSGTTGAKAISRTGAGDAFGSGFVAALIKTGDLKIALRTGTLNAESVIQSHGAKLGILSRFPSKNSLKKIPIKII